MSNELRQTPQYANYMISLGWQTNFIKPKIQIFFKKVLPFFYIGKAQRFDELFTFGQFKNTLQKKGLYIIYLEPNTERQLNYFVNKLNFVRTASPLVPSKTIRINLNKSEKELLGEMHYKTRYNIKKVSESKFVVESTGNIKEFADFWQKNALKRGMFLSLKSEIKEIFKAFEANAEILVAKTKNKILSAIMTVMTGDVIYYMYAASTPEGNKMFAPTALVWEAIKLGKKKNLKYFDFEGIYDDRFPLKSWKGFTRFKKSFGGKEISYPGTLKRFVFVI
jgi:lipid II:glycine glycyltransferase (peptidoglycan interpeptide bridge formation enzyme)